MDRWLVLIIGIAFFCCQVGCKENKYSNYALIRILPQDDKQMEVVRNFNVSEGQVEILKKSYGINDSLDILVPLNERKAIWDYVEVNHLHHEVKSEHYGRSFDVPDIERSRRLLRGFSVFAYNSYSSILEHINVLAARKPAIIKLQTLGNSYQGRRMKLVKISANHQENNPIIFIDAGVHAREWAAPAMAMYIIDRLTMDANSLYNELQGVDWYILPVVNPDGYEFTRTNVENRLWRKTRSKAQGLNCYGVDGNRNYGFKWGLSGVSNNPCDQETFAGSKPFSEAETRMVRNVMMENAQRIKLYVSLHAYGQYIVYPWGYTGSVLPTRWKALDALARKVSKAVVNAGGDSFNVMSAGQWYPAAGGSDDFAYGAVGIPYSYTMELTDGYEFQFPEANLKEALPQYFEGFKVFAKQIKEEFGHRSSSVFGNS